MPNTSGALGGTVETFLPKEQSRRLGQEKVAVAYLFAIVSLDLHFFRGFFANVLVISVALALIVYTPENFRARLLGYDWLYLSYLSFIVYSAVWSLSPSTTLEQALPLALPWIAALLLCGLSAVWVARIVVRFAIVVALLSPAMIFVSSKLAYQPRSSSGAPELRGVFYHQLALGAFLTIALGLIVISYLNGHGQEVLGRSRILRGCALILILGVLVLARARLHVGSGVIALALTCLLSKRGSRKWVAVNLLVVAGAVTASFVNALRGYLDSTGFDTTLTGRTYVWERILTGIEADARTLGHGFGSLQLPEFDHLFANYRASHAHNYLIQAYFDTGLVGLTLLIILLVVLLGTAWRSSVKSNTYSYSLFLVLFCIITGLTSGVLAVALSAPFCLMLLFLAIESRGSSASVKTPTGRRLFSHRLAV